MLVLSKYNYLHKVNGKTILFNSLSHVILVMQDENELYELQNKDYENSLAQKFLVDNHILVRADVDEKALAKLIKSDAVYDNELKIMIYPTTACNFKCVYCYEDLVPCSMNENVTQRLKSFFRRQILSYESVSIEWFGGEPLLMKDLIYEISESVVKICKRIGRKFRASITTNGYLLDIETFRKMLKCHVYTYVITIDGPARVHDRLRILADGNGTFDRIIENLIAIRDSVREKYFTILIRVNVTHSLLGEFDEFMRFLDDNFGHDSRFKFQFRIVVDYGVKDIEVVNKELLNEMDVVYDYLLRSEINLDCSGQFELLQNQMCDAVKKNFYIVYIDGSIFKCTNLLPNEKTQVGHLGANGELILDRTKLVRWMGKVDKEGKCNDCNFAPLCKECPAREEVMKHNNPCIMTGERIGKVLELLIKNSEIYSNGFVYKLTKGVIDKC